MKKFIKNYKGVLFFYLIIILSAFAITARFNYLNEKTTNDNNLIAAK